MPALRHRPIGYRSQLTSRVFWRMYDARAATLSVGKAKISQWLSRTVKENKDRRNRKIFDLWLACWTQEEIAEEVGCPVGTIKDLLSGDESLVGKVLQNQINQAAAFHVTDFDAPLYNVWKQQEKTNEARHFGNSLVNGKVRPA